MPEVEIFDKNEKIIMKIELPFVPASGEFISIEREDYFKYYRVTERWIRIEELNKSVACVEVELKD